MEYEYDSLIDDDHINECNEIRSIAKKSWLSSAGVSLAHLDNVKAKVYNVGLADPRDLKATNLREKKNRNTADLPTNPPLSTLSLQQTARCGSNTSIPELVRQHSSDKLLHTRPASATTRKLRPPSGKKPRPQSAKEPLPTLSQDTGQTFGVKGAKYDPSGRPPKGIPSNTTTGWVGPPAGLKYPDRPPSGQGWKLEFVNESSPNGREAHSPHVYDAPPPPQGTPVPPNGSPEPSQQEEKTKRIFEVFIGDPYKTAENDEEDLFEDSDSDFGPLSPVEQPPAPVLLRKPTPESLRLSLPAADDEDDDELEMDTERLLMEAEMVTKKLDLQHVFALNKVNPPAGSTGQMQESLHHEDPYTDYNQHQSDLTIEEDVSTVIGDEQIYLDNTNKEPSFEHFTTKCNISDSVIDHNNERKGIIHDPKAKPLSEQEKSFVKFSEDKNVTVDITPRNVGRKVTELQPQKKKKTPEDSFVDLIEVKNRIEPILKTGGIPLSPNKPVPPKRPPSGKLRTTQNSQLQKGILSDKSQCSISSLTRGHTDKKDLRVTSTVDSSKSNLLRQRSAPLNRSVTPIATVTVDYGEDNCEKSGQKTDDKSVADTKTKRRKKKNEDDVVTMMQKIGLDDDPSNEVKLTSAKDIVEYVLKNEQTNHEIEAAQPDSDTQIPIVYKSEPEKNYYEFSRHSSMSGKDEVKVEDSNKVYKTTKTIEFDELKPKEVTVKNLIDPQLASVKEKEKFLSSASDISDIKRGRNLSRPSSASITTKPPIPSEGRSSSLERPSSRIGFVAMAPDTSTQKTESKKVLNRPSSAPTSKLNLNQQRGPGMKSKTKTTEKDEQKPLTAKEKEERDKVIDNLLERTKTLLGEKEEESSDTTTEKSKRRPTSAYAATLRSKDQRCVKSAAIRRPASAVTRRTTNHKHSGSCKTPRKSSAKKRTVKPPEPCVITTNTSFDPSNISAAPEPGVITTNTSFDEEETPEDMWCQDMEKDLSDKGINIKAETLQRALYPPTGRTKYYRLTADLPRSNSLTLLSHPKVWLPQEYKKLQKAEKTLSKANEIMHLQHKAELQRAKLAEMGPEELKKQKQKGKRTGKKLRRSNSFG